METKSLVGKLLDKTQLGYRRTGQNLCTRTLQKVHVLSKRELEFKAKGLLEINWKNESGYRRDDSGAPVAGCLQHLEDMEKRDVS